MAAVWRRLAQVARYRVSPRRQRVSRVMADGRTKVLQLSHLPFQPVLLAAQPRGQYPGGHVGTSLDRGEQPFSPRSGRRPDVQPPQPRAHRVQLGIRQDIALPERDPRVCTRVFQRDPEDCSVSRAESSRSDSRTSSMFRIPTAVRSVPPVLTVGFRHRRYTTEISPRVIRSSAELRSNMVSPIHGDHLVLGSQLR